jgi:hypothetical protein
MKKQTILLFMTLLGQFLYAQEGEIIYQEFEPAIHYSFICDLNASFAEPWVPIDLDHNGENDYWFHVRRDEWYCGQRMTFTYGSTVPYNMSRQRLVHEGDTLSKIDLGMEGSTVVFKTTGIYWIGVRWQRDEGYCYGWIKTSLESSDFTFAGDPINMQFYIHGMALCTQPDYPLIVGQTSFDWDVVDNEEIPIATVHPNPTTGVVRIIGKDLKAAEIINTLGQRVATAQGKGDQMTIDIANLPEGVYFVRITNEQGRKCVRKVVKE